MSTPPAAATDRTVVPPSSITTLSKTMIWFLSIVYFAFVGFLALRGSAAASTIFLWAAIALLIVGFLLLLGLGANGMLYGVLIDNRNRTSLSRLQITLWTILTISAFLSIVFTRLSPRAFTNCTAELLAKAAEDGKFVSFEAWKTSDPNAAAEAEKKATAQCKSDDPLNITFPDQILIAMGISTASFAGSSLIQSNKRNKSMVTLNEDLESQKSAAETLMKQKEKAFIEISTKLRNAYKDKTDAEKFLQENPDAAQEVKDETTKKLNAALQSIELNQETGEAYKKAEKEFNDASTKVETLKQEVEEMKGKQDGLLKINKNPQDAKLGDMFQGDEQGNYQLVDLSKVQMFFFTIAIILAYAMALAHVLKSQTALMGPLGVDFPPFSDTLNTLLGISHAGYLSVKSIDHTKTRSVS